MKAAHATRAVLFDFNGVLVDDETYHWRAFREVLAPFGVRLTRPRYNARYLVYDDRTALQAMLRDARLGAALRGTARPRAATIERLLRRKRQVYARLASRVRIETRAARLVRAVARRVPVAVVSGASRREVAAALRRARLARLFRAIVTAEDVRRPKPRPDGYRLALRRLGLRDGRGCLAIEDSPGGVAAARAAGLEVIGVATTFAPALLRRAGALQIVASLGSLSAGSLLTEGAVRPIAPTAPPSRRRPTRRRS